MIKRVQMTNSSDTFRYWAPATLVKAGPESDGKMSLAGIASTSSKDADGEFLEPEGFELDYFLKHGYMNWNHQTSKDPLALIGKPTEAVVKAEGLHVACDLFDNSPRAREVFHLAQILEERGDQLGFSIEGKVIERDEKNPKIVKKAKITGCAITPNPKNKDTVASIIKGEDLTTLSAYEEEDEESQEKALSAGSASGQALAKEDLDKRTKVLTYDFGDLGQHDLSDKKKKKKKKLTKGEALTAIFTEYPGIEKGDALSYIDLTNKIEKINQMKNDTDVTISSEALAKAHEILGLVKEEQQPSEASSEREAAEDLEKGYKDMKKMMSSMDKEELKKMSKMMSATLKKMEDEEGDEEDANEDEEGNEDEEVEKGDLTPKQKKHMDKDKDGDIDKEDFKMMKKGEESLPDLIKSQISQINSENSEKWFATTTLIKSLQDELGELRDTVEQIGSASVGRKSVTAQAHIEKSWANDLEPGNADNKQKLSITRNKKQILDMLEETYFVKGDLVDQKLGNESAIYESSNQISKGIIDCMAEKGYELVG